jgi:3-oxoadipate enol-lactonase
MDRTVVGRREFARVTAGRGPAAVGKVAEASPVLADGVSEFIFADVFSRPGLSARERELVTVAVLCALGGAEPQLGLHIPAALEAGVDPDELIAMCEQIAPYAGFPRALNGLRAVRGVLEERGLPLPLPAERVVLGDHETLVTDVGEGDAPAVVLIHPLGLDRLVWRQVIRALPAGRRALAFDLRGHGGAGGAPPAAPGSLAADIVSLLAARGVDGDVELVGAGTSVGAALAGARGLGGRARAVTLLGRCRCSRPQRGRTRCRCGSSPTRRPATGRSSATCATASRARPPRPGRASTSPRRPRAGSRCAPQWAATIRWRRAYRSSRALSARR